MGFGLIVDSLAQKKLLLAKCGYEMAEAGVAPDTGRMQRFFSGGPIIGTFAMELLNNIGYPVYNISNLQIFMFLRLTFPNPNRPSTPILAQ